MTPTVIPDEDLIAFADATMIWVATPDAPTDVWSLTEAIEWVMRQQDRSKIVLFRPAARGLSSAWVQPEQIERLACVLCAEPSDAA